MTLHTTYGDAFLHEIAKNTLKKRISQSYFTLQETSFENLFPFSSQAAA
jgi:hypothetical protein